MLESKYPSCYVKIPGTANGSSELQRLPAEHWKAFVEGLQRVMKATGRHVLDFARSEKHKLIGSWFRK